MISVQQLQLLFSEGGSQGCYGVCDSYLLHLDDVRSSFHDIEQFLFCSLFLCCVKPKKVIAFRKEERFGSIHILAAFLLVLVHGASGIADDTSVFIADRYHEPVIVEAVVVAFLGGANQVQFLHQRYRQPFILGKVYDIFPVFRCIADAELFYLLRSPPANGIAIGSLGLRSILVEATHKMLLHILVDDEGTILFPSQFKFFLSRFAVLFLFHLDVVFVSQNLTGFYEAAVFLLHDE